jgi:uncharacterized membrane protein (UPF0127 family)
MRSFATFRSRALLVLAVAVLCAAAFVFFGKPYVPGFSEVARVLRVSIESPTLHRAQVGDVELFVKYAQTETERAQGLSGHAPLGPREGMLFIFPFASSYGFWMKDMLFDLDMVWIRSGLVVGISEHIPAPRFAGDKLPTYYPPEAADMVLEIGSGQARALGIGIGDAVSLFDYVSHVLQ